MTHTRADRHLPRDCLGLPSLRYRPLTGREAHTMRFEIMRNHNIDKPHSRATWDDEHELWTIEIQTLTDLIAVVDSENPYHALAIQRPRGPGDDDIYAGVEGIIIILDTPYWD